MFKSELIALMKNAAVTYNVDQRDLEQIGTKVFERLQEAKPKCRNCLYFQSDYPEGTSDAGHCRYLPIKHGGFPMIQGGQWCRCHEHECEIDGEVRP